MRIRVKGQRGHGYEMQASDEDIAAKKEIETEASPASLIKKRLGKQIIHVEFVDADTEEVLVISVYRLQPGEIYMIDETIFTPALHAQMQTNEALTPEAAIDLTQEALGLKYRYEAIEKWKARTIDIVYAALVDEELKDKAFLATCDADVLRTLCNAALGRYTEANSVTRFPEVAAPTGK